jgi:DNA-directed RNA polymerase specialized sigma24 family protein
VNVAVSQRITTTKNGSGTVSLPIDHITGWLFRVARNRITDLFRKKKPERLGDAVVADEDDELLQLEDLLPSPDARPEAFTPATYCSMNSCWRSRNMSQIPGAAAS